MDIETHLHPGMIDSHAHLSLLREKGFDPVMVASDCLRSGMTWILDVGISDADIAGRRALADEIHRMAGGAVPADAMGTSSAPTGGGRRILLSAGIYPSECADPALARRLATLESAIGEGGFTAVGEIGLDYYHDYGTRTAQRDLFGSQLAIAAAHGLPVVIHNRDADGDVLDAVREAGHAAGVGIAGVMHCFSSDWTFATRCLDAGLYISFAGNVTFGKSDGLRDVARRIPSNRILLETDSPYLAPHPRRGRPNHPGLIGHTYDAVASLRGEDVEELTKQVRRNFERLMNVTAAPWQGA